MKQLENKPQKSGTREILSWFLRIGAVFGVIFLLSFAFAFSDNWNFSFNREEEPSYYKSGIFSEPMVELSAENIFGANMTERTLNIALNYLMVKNPQGLENFSTSTMTVFDKAKINLMAQAEIYKTVNRELVVYSESELMMVPDSTAATDNYLRSLKKISDNYLERFRGDDIESLAFEAGNNNNDEARKKLIDFIDSSEQALSELVKVPAPKSWVVFHLGFLNLASETRYMALGYLLFENDPTRGSLAFNNYEDLSYRISAFNWDFQKKIEEYSKIRQ